jgi:hypothetical protein
MNTFIYTVSATPFATGKTHSKSQSLTGTTNVTFSLSGLNEHYESSASYKINKIVVDYDEGIRGRDGFPADNLIINRPLSTTTIPTISAETFVQTLQTDFTDKIDRHVYFTIYRDDLQVDVVDVRFTMFKPPIDIYENINLLKTDYFNNDEDNEKILLTFINKNPEVLGLSLLDLDEVSRAGYDPSLSNSGAVSATTFNVGFTTDYVRVNGGDSNTGDQIKVKLDDFINLSTGEVKDNGNITLRYRTRAADPNNNSLSAIALPGSLNTFYIPLTANSGFLHLSGFLNWNCGDLQKDVSLSTQSLTIPLIDIKGTRMNLADYYFTNVNTGVGTSMHGLVSGGYFYVDVFDITSCDSVTTTTSTITAFVNY